MPTKFIHIEPTCEMRSVIDEVANRFITSVNLAHRHLQDSPRGKVKIKHFSRAFQMATESVCLPGSIFPMYLMRIFSAQSELIDGMLRALNTQDGFVSKDPALSFWATIQIPLILFEGQAPLVDWFGIPYAVPLGEIDPGGVEDISVSYTKGEALFLKVELWSEEQLPITQTPSVVSKEEKSDIIRVGVAPFFPDISALYEADKAYTLSLYRLADGRLTDRDNAEMVSNAKQARDWVRKVFLDQFRRRVVESTDYYVTQHLPVTALDDHDITAGALSRAATNVVLHVIRSMAIYTHTRLSDGCEIKHVLHNIDSTINREFCDHGKVSERKVALFKAVARYPIDIAFYENEHSCSSLNLMLMLIRSEWV